MIDFPHLCIVPAKACSERVPEKNFRPFWKDMSLVDITVQRLLAAGVDPDLLFISSEDEGRVEVADAWGVGFHHRSARLADNDTPLTDWIRGTVADLRAHAPNADVIWAQVCNPFFDEYATCFDHWEKFRHTSRDSLVIRHPQKRYLMGPDGLPIGWGWGSWHRKSQRLPVTYQFTWCLSILKPWSVDNVGYHIGADPLWFDSHGPAIDIDTEEDFEIARQLFAARNPE